MEITNDLQFLLPIMVAIMVSKWTGDLLTHPFYHALLEVNNREMDRGGYWGKLVCLISGSGKEGSGKREVQKNLLGP